MLELGLVSRPKPQLISMIILFSMCWSCSSLGEREKIFLICHWPFRTWDKSLHTSPALTSACLPPPGTEGPHSPARGGPSPAPGLPAPSPGGGWTGGSSAPSPAERRSQIFSWWQSRYHHLTVARHSPPCPRNLQHYPLFLFLLDTMLLYTQVSVVKTDLHHQTE